MDTIEVIAQGRVFEIVDNRKLKSDNAPKPPPSTRGVIRVMSRKSRNRLIDLFNRIEATGLQTKFITLTFAGTPTHAEAYACFRRFLERLRRKHPETSAVWRKELQERGSIHYHMLVYNMPYYPQRKLQNVWTDCTGEPRSIVDIRAVYSDAHASRYVSKYIAKLDDRETTSLEEGPYSHADEEVSTGRWWGMHNGSLLPFAPRYSFTITGRDHTRYIAWWIEKLTPHVRHSGYLTRKIYTEDALRMWQHAEAIEQPANPPFLKTHHHERRYLDRQRTVQIPLQPPSMPDWTQVAVGESDAVAEFERGRTDRLRLMAKIADKLPSQNTTKRKARKGKEVWYDEQCGGSHVGTDVRALAPNPSKQSRPDANPPNQSQAIAIVNRG